jgi:RNA polymerase sigma factor (TIGR02999 family)
MPDGRDARGEVTRLIEAMGRGESGQGAALLDLVYSELRAMAAAQMARERPGHTLQPTALVHEAYLRLMEPRGASGGPAFQSRSHFFGAAGEAMRRILVDQARARRARKRGGYLERTDLADASAPAGAPDGGVDLVALSDALSRMEREDERMATIVKLRFFAEMTVDEIAAALDMSRRTVLRDWTAARAWLAAELRGAEG